MLDLFSIDRSSDILGFFKGDKGGNKDIINSYNFYVEFVFVTSNITKKIKPYHFLNVDIPNHSFTRISVNYGATQYSIPVLNKEQSLDIKFTMEEDTYGTIGRFIDKLKQTVVKDGLHRFPKDSRLGNIYIYIMDRMKNEVTKYVARNVFFLGAEPLSMSYDSNESLKYSLTFGTDYFAFDSELGKKLEEPPRAELSRASFR